MAVVGVAICIWIVVSWQTRAVIAHKDAEIKLLERQLAHPEEKNSESIATDKKIQAAPQSVKASERIFVETTADYLHSLFDNKPKIQGDKLAQSYIGKWLELSGCVDDIAQEYIFFRGVSIRVTFLYFDGNLAERFHALQPGQEIRAVGQISLLQSNLLVLRHCEIVSKR